MRFSRLYLLLFLTATLINWSLPSLGKEESPSSSRMSGYSLNEFGDFTKKWKFVTVRYRRDTSEMRFTYANDKAWQALRDNSTDYPDGAIFAKVGALTKEDPAFPSSAVPSGARRVQFMVRDKKKHAATDGWGYALFDSEGKVPPGDLHAAAQACAACHRIVPQRGLVFSQPMEFTGAPSAHEMSWQNHLKFVDKGLQFIPENIKSFLPEDVRSVRVVTGELSKNVFAGTLDEIRPLLAKETFRSKETTALISENGELFSLVVIDRKNEKCSAEQMSLKGVHTLLNAKTSFFEIRFCQGPQD